MKRTLLTLLIIMLVRIIGFSSNTLILTESDSIVSITTSDLKYANLIFVEHNKLLRENNLFKNQLENYKILNNHLEQVDSLRQQQIGEYQGLNQSYILQIENLNKDIQNKNRAILGWKIGSITVSAGLVLFLLLK